MSNEVIVLQGLCNIIDYRLLSRCGKSCVIIGIVSKILYLYHRRFISYSIFCYSTFNPQLRGKEKKKMTKTT